jgi:hypothetical protein
MSRSINENLDSTPDHAKTISDTAAHMAVCSAASPLNSSSRDSGFRMAEKSNRKEGPEGDPKRGDALLKRMLKTPPKPHKDMKKGKVAEKKRGDDK